jgi:serpin B
MRKLGLFVLALSVPAAAEETPLGRTQGRFAFDLHARLPKDGNLFHSPYSVSTALLMTLAGARGNTEAEMRAVLRVPGDLPNVHAASEALRKGLAGPFRLSVANALWGQKGVAFLEPFLELERRCYDARLEALDFAAPEEACRVVNGWVEERTEGKIRDLLGPELVGPDTRLVLTNAVYFRAAWEKPFSTRSTADAPFTLANGEAVNVPTMRQTATFDYAEEDGLQLVALPYEGGRLSMIVLVPRDLAALERRLADEGIGKLFAGAAPCRVGVHLPRFRVESKLRLDDPLRDLGMKDAFGAAADFSGMTGRRDLFVSAVVHQAFVDVNEAGTEAAAATAVAVLKGAPPEDPVIFRADRPFLFLVRDAETGTVLFVGRVADPR